MRGIIAANFLVYSNFSKMFVDSVMYLVISFVYLCRGYNCVVLCIPQTPTVTTGIVMVGVMVMDMAMAMVVTVV